MISFNSIHVPVNPVVPWAFVAISDIPAVAVPVNVMTPALLAMVELPAEEEPLKFKDPVLVMFDEPALLVSRKFVVPPLKIAFVPKVAPLITFIVAGPCT